MPMRTKIVVPLLAGALALPAFAGADLGPHSSYYDVNPKAMGQANDVGITVYRPKHQAYVYITNFCLGSQSYSGKSYPATAQLPGTVGESRASIPIRNGRIRWHGNAATYSQQGKETLLRASLTATVTARKVVGSVTLAGKCGTIRFTAKLNGYNK